MESTQHPISRLFKVELGPTGEPLRRALAVIDSVHCDGSRPAVELVRTILPLAPLKSLTLEGYYRYDVSKGRVLGLSVGKTCQRPELTTVHEVGHYLDHNALGTPGTFSSEWDPLLEDWRIAVEQTQEVSTLRHRLKVASFTVSRDGVRRKYIRVDHRVIRYYLQYTELFARSYAQYIAITSNDPILMVQYNKKLTHPRHSVIPTQWERNSFEPVRTTIDTLFRKKGWRP